MWIERRDRWFVAQILVSENKALMGGLHDKRTKQIWEDSHIATLIDDQGVSQSKLLSMKERRESYNREQDSLTHNQAFVCVSKNTVSSNANIIGSRVVYCRKLDGTSKTQIVSWSYRDIEKYELRGGALSINLGSTRLLLPSSAEHRWPMEKMDVKSANLQAKGFTRDIYVQAPHEENYIDGLLTLDSTCSGIRPSWLRSSIVIDFIWGTYNALWN